MNELNVGEGMKHFNRFKASIIALIFVLVVGIGFGTSQFPAQVEQIEQTIANTQDDAKSSNDAELQQATVERVVDGDTIIVELDGVEQRVRLIGIDTPESVHPDESRNTEAGDVASDHTKSIVKSGDRVYLQKDVSDTDKYDRLLRYVWLEKPTDTNNESEIKTKMLNAILISEGYAEPKEYEPDTAYADTFERLEKAA